MNNYPRSVDNYVDNVHNPKYRNNRAEETA